MQLLKFLTLNLFPMPVVFLLARITDSSFCFHTPVGNTMVGLQWLLNEYLWNRNEMNPVVNIFWSHE